MKQFIEHGLYNQTFIVSSNRFIFWEEKKSMILSDLHLGKTGHFRKSGIAVPQNIYKEDMHRLVDAIQFFKPDHLIIVGDLFHSRENKELGLFTKWRNDFKNLSIQLVKGNHDILPPDWYKKMSIEIVHDCLLIDHFCFTHDMNTLQNNTAQYIFSGHIHPGIYIKGAARQGFRLPCFYFTDNYAILPAFGKFTGNYSIEPDKEATVYAIMPANIYKGENGGLMKI